MGLVHKLTSSGPRAAPWAAPLTPVPAPRRPGSAPLSVRRLRAIPFFEENTSSLPFLWLLVLSGIQRTRLSNMFGNFLKTHFPSFLGFGATGRDGSRAQPAVPAQGAVVHSVASRPTVGGRKAASWELHYPPLTVPFVFPCNVHQPWFYAASASGHAVPLELLGLRWREKHPGRTLSAHRRLPVPAAWGADPLPASHGGPCGYGVRMLSPFIS